MLDHHLAYESAYQMTTAVLAIITNSTLFWLIKTKSPPNLGGYKYLMMYIALFEIFYACFDFFFLPYVYSNWSGFLVFLDPLFELPLAVVQVLDYIFTASFAFAIALFAIHFVYRYCVVSGNKKWTSTKPSIVIFWLSIPIIVSLLWVAVCIAFLGQNQMSDGFLWYEFETKTRLAYVGPFFDFRLDFEHNLHVYWGLSLLILIGFVCFATMVFFGVKCRFKLHALAKDTHQSSTTKSLEAQLFSVLIAQSMIPFFFVFCPIAVLAISIYWNWSHPAFGRVLTMTNAIYPVFDPLPNMLMIKPYRRALIWWNPRKKNSKIAATANRRTSFLEIL